MHLLFVDFHRIKDTMMTNIYQAAAILIGLFIYISGGVLEERFDWSCYKNVTHRNETDIDPDRLNQVVSLTVMEPPPPINEEILGDFSYLAFTADACALDIYLHGYWSPYVDGFINHDHINITCTHIDTSVQLLMQVTIVRVGDPNDRSIVNTDHPLPSSWLERGLVLRFHFEKFLHVNGLLLICQPTYFGRRYPGVNVDFVINLKGCPSGKYGGDCSQNCSCINGATCHYFNGECFCVKGWKGDDCSIIDPMVEITQSPEKLFYTGNVTLTCTAYGMTAKVMTWTKGVNQLKQTDRHTIRLLNDVLELEITQVDLGDTGEYKCTIEDTADKTYTKIYHLNSTDPQHFVTQPDDVVTQTGSDIILQCKVVNRVGKLAWYVDTNMLLADADVIAEWAKGRFTVDWDDESGNFDLIIQNVQAEDDREYYCVAGPGFDQKAIVSRYAQITVLEKAKSPVIEEAYYFTSLAFLADVPVTATCRADNGNPPASIRWYKNGELVTENVTTHLEVGTRNSMNTVSVITLHPKHSDIGSNVTCKAGSEILGYEEQTSVTLVDVKYKPRVDITYSPLAPKKGDDVTFTCQVEANPNNITSFNWTIDGIHIKGHHGDAYTLNNIQWKQSQLSVTCSAENEVGIGSNTIGVEIVVDSFNKYVVIGVLVASVSLALILAAPVVTYRYKYRIQRRLMWYFGVYEENDGKTFDAFVYYHGTDNDVISEDEKFVCGTLIPELERGGKYCICEHQRNFIPGIDIFINIIKAIEKSRRTILVLSPSFIQDDLCRFVFLKAQEEMLKRKTKMIIPILFEDISEVRQSDANIDSMLKEISYVTWSGDEKDMAKFWNNLKYSLPKKRPQKNVYVQSSPTMLDPN
ncbi:uncharacterized protein LOC144436685 [Glandiceps talaboti]